MLLVVLEAWSLVFKTDHFKFALLIVYMFIQCRGSGDGLMVGVFDSGSSYLVSALAGDIANCVLGQDTFSQCLSPPRCINGYQ